MILALSPARAGATSGSAAVAGKAAVRTWLGLDDSVFRSLETDLKVISADSMNGSSSAVAAGCQELSADVATIDGLSRIPNAPIEKRWSDGLGDFERGAADCIHGILDSDQTLLRRSVPLLRSGEKQVNAVLTKLRHLVSRSGKGAVGSR